MNNSFCDPLFDKLTAISARLTNRDRRICHLLFDHRVLTTTQITDIAFDSPITARHRLQLLHGLDVVERFRVFTGTKTSQHHFVLGEAGALIAAADRGQELDTVTWRRIRALAVAKSGQLAHLTGVNGVFARLLKAQRQGVGELTEWWSERRCVLEWGDDVRPDGFGQWHQADMTLQFFLEYDRGTESLTRVKEKLDRYSELLSRIGPTAPVLFVFESPKRETSFRKLVSGLTWPVVATTSRGDAPAGEVWRSTDGAAFVDLRGVIKRALQRVGSIASVQMK